MPSLIVLNIANASLHHLQGFVVSDWYGQHGGIATAEAGLDMAMPESDGMWAGELVTAINNGTFSESRLDDMVTRYVKPSR